jgi:hypothetical protein
MIRRKFIILIGISGVAGMAFFFLENLFLRRIFYKIEDLFKSPVKVPPDSEREEVELPLDGYATPVEMALNSRCNSDTDGNPKRFHWGMFDTTKKLSDTQIGVIIRLAKIPRFTEERIEIQTDGTTLTFIIDNNTSGKLRDWVMVESGMQQQAVGLICAAFGVSMRFMNLGHDGTPVSTTEYATTRMKLNPMKPSYGDSFWTSSPPTGRKPWLKGKLPDPLRDGEKPLISALDGVQATDKTGKTATERAISQLLWAARGRTPHFYKARPWGMTIPTSQGKQDISCVYMISDNKLSRYVNWQRNRPTNSLEVMGDIGLDLHNELSKSFQSNNCFFIIGRNKHFAEGFWEVGYQLLNLLIQAHALGVAYHAALLDETHKNMLNRLPINDPTAILALQIQSASA